MLGMLFLVSLNHSHQKTCFCDQSVRFWAKGPSGRSGTTSKWTREVRALCFFQAVSQRLCALNLIWFLKKKTDLSLCFFRLIDIMFDSDPVLRRKKKHILRRNDFWSLSGCLWLKQSHDSARLGIQQGFSPEADTNNQMLPNAAWKNSSKTVKELQLTYPVF